MHPILAHIAETPPEEMDEDSLNVLWKAYLAEGEPPSLAEFVALTSPWQPEPWQEIICKRLERLHHERGQRLLIHGPPQFGKSLLVSQRFPCWLLGMNPDLRIRLACYNISHAERFSKVNLAIMRMKEYREVFPDPRCRVPNICPAEEWSTAERAGKLDAQPSFKALGLGSGVVGLGGDLFLIDDPYKNFEEAQSEATNTTIWEWWTKVVMPRINPETNIVVMFHRWRLDDFAGRLAQQGGWEQMRFPAIADDGEHDPTERNVGETLSPRYPVAFLRQQEQNDPQGFLALYQGRPVKEGGNFLPMDKVRHAEHLPQPGSADYPLITVFQAWDLAISTKTTADYTVCATLGVDRDANLYLLDVFRDRLSFNDTIAKMKEQADRFKPTRIAIESVGYQSAAFQEASRRYLLPFEEIKPSKDKVTRAQLLADRIAMGKTYANKAARWWGEFASEAAAFPFGSKDDQVDAMAYALHLAQTHWSVTERPVPAPYFSPDAVTQDRQQRRYAQARSAMDS